MINLIPPAAKKSISIEYWIRVVSVWFIIWSVTLLMSASIFLPTYVLINAQVKVHAESATEASQKVADYENVSTALINANREAKLIVDEAAAVYFSNYIELFESLEGKSVQITEINMSRDDELLKQATVGGIASDRHSLASFRDQLLSNERVAEVEFPISNLAQDKDIPFKMQVVFDNQSGV